MTKDWTSQLAAALACPGDDPLVIRLAALLNDLATGRMTDNQAQTELETDPALVPARSQVSFQGASITGNVTIGDIAGGHVIKISVRQIVVEQAYDVRGLPNPYLGLRSFTYAERERFAGRQHLIEAAVQKLTQPGMPRPLLFITGASGSGKSSFAQAGVLPALEAYYAEQELTARRAVFRPSRQPLLALVDALLQLGLPALTGDSADIAGTQGGFAIFVQTHTPAQQVNLLVLDQFEELFTQSGPSERDMLFALLEQLPRFASIHTHLLATLRADYLPELFAHQTLYDLAKQGIDLRAMNEDELKDAILRPLQQTYPNGAKRFEDALLKRLVQDAQGNAAYLPLLQVTLEDLWRRGHLRLSAYGSLTDAIRQRAEQVYAYADYDGARQIERSERERTTILDIFLDLVEVSLDDDIRRDVRRRRTALQLKRGSGERARLIADLATARLLNTGVERAGDTEIEVVDIIHETLIGNWDRLRQAIAVKRGVLRQRIRFEQALREWLVHDRANDYLLDGVRLAEAQDLDQRGDIALGIAEARELLRRSVDRREAERQQQFRRTRRFASVLLIILVLAVASAVFGFAQQNIAQQRTIALQTQLNTSEAQRLAFAAESLFNDEPETALLLAYEAAAHDHSLFTEQVLQDALVRIPGKLTVYQQHTGIVTSAIFSPDGQHILTGSFDHTARLWNLNGQSLVTFTGHTKEVANAQFSPDGQYVLTASKDGTARLWNLKGRLVMLYSGNDGELKDAHFSPDGQHILTIPESMNGRLRLWERSGKMLVAFTGHTDQINSAVFSPDGQHILTASKDRTARLWDLQGQQVALFTGHTKGVDSAVFSPDGHFILTGSSDDTTRLWNLDDQSFVIFDAHNGAWSAQFSPDGNGILTASNDGLTRLWYRSGELLTKFSGNFPFTGFLAFSPDGQYVLTASRLRGVAQLWDLEGRLLATFQADKQGFQLTSASFSPDGRRVLFAYSDFTARSWDLAVPTQTNVLHVRRTLHSLSLFQSIDQALYSPNGKLILTTSSGTEAQLWDLNGQNLATFEDGVYSAVFSPNGQYVLTADHYNTARLWELNGKVRTIFSGHTDSVRKALFSPDGQHVLTVSADHTARLWDLNGQLLAIFTGHTDFINSAIFSPDGQRVLTASDDHTARLWDLNGQLLTTFTGHVDSISQAVFNPDGQRVLTASNDGTARLWNLKGQQIVVLSGHGQDVESAIFSPDGQSILTASADTTARIWNLHGETISILKGHSWTVKSAVFSPDGQRVLTASDDGTARLWDLAGQPMLIFHGHLDQINSAVFSPEGQRVLTASSDGTARQYVLTMDDLQALAACWVGRELTDDEVVRFQVGTPRFDFDKRVCPPVFSWRQGF